MTYSVYLVFPTYSLSLYSYLRRNTNIVYETIMIYDYKFDALDVSGRT